MPSRWYAVLRSEAVNINKRYISSFFMRSSTLGRSGGLGILASNILFCLALADAGAETMKLFRTAFWLGVVIYNFAEPGLPARCP